jgi:two-component system chemotaxis sensor kinase CheA
MDDMWGIYLSETTENLDNLEQDIIELERGKDPVTIANIYRNIHTIKGNSAIVGFGEAEHFSHALEDLLGAVQTGHLVVSGDVIEILLKGVDWLKFAILNVDSKDLKDDERKELLLRQIAGIIGSPSVSAGSSGTLSPEDIPEGALVGSVDGQHEELPAAETDTGKLLSEQHTGKAYFRMDADKMDTLLDLVGELVISGSHLHDISGDIGSQQLTETVSQITRMIEDLRDTTQTSRLVNIGDTFNRYKRIVRDLSKQYRKKIDFGITGGETKLDKTIVEKVSDPLMHLVRNAVYHGIETPDVRTGKGKPETGHLSLNASYEMGQVVITVKDDGKGLDAGEIARKAVELGYLEDGNEVPGDVLQQMLFKSGFTTVSEASNISGRGVGLDVVKRNIESLRGTIHVTSNVDIGTEFRLQLPLTVGIIDGFLVRIHDAFCILPTSNISECLGVGKQDLTLSEGWARISHRESLLPVVSLRRFFHAPERDTEAFNILVFGENGVRVGLVVDTILGEVQTVIKPLTYVLKGASWISGTAVLGSGDIALILDMPNLLREIENDYSTTIS